MKIKWTKEVPTIAGWYWVIWKGYEFPEVVIVTQKENEIYTAGQSYMIEPTDVIYWSEQPLYKPDLPWK
jgi:hypothetical protein